LVLATPWALSKVNPTPRNVTFPAAALIQVARPLPNAEIDPRVLQSILVALAFTYFDFATSDLERHQLMDMPMMRDFTPSEEAYRPALECYQVMRSVLNEIGIRQQPDLDIYTALTGGFVNQQLANDPKGDRWRVLAKALLPRRVITWGKAARASRGLHGRVSLREIVVCPTCKGPVEWGVERIACAPCRVEYPIVQGIPRLLPTDALP